MKKTGRTIAGAADASGTGATNDSAADVEAGVQPDSAQAAEAEDSSDDEDAEDAEDDEDGDEDSEDDEGGAREWEDRTPVAIDKKAHKRLVKEQNREKRKDKVPKKVKKRKKTVAKRK